MDKSYNSHKKLNVDEWLKDVEKLDLKKEAVDSLVLNLLKQTRKDVKEIKVDLNKMFDTLRAYAINSIDSTLIMDIGPQPKINYVDPSTLPKDISKYDKKSYIFSVGDRHDVNHIRAIIYGSGPSKKYSRNVPLTNLLVSLGLNVDIEYTAIQKK